MSKIVELRERLEAKQAALAQIFDQAGPAFDFTLITSIDGDVSAKAAEIKRRNDEIAGIKQELKDYEDASAVFENLKSDRAENAKPVSRPHLGGGESKAAKQTDEMLGFKNYADYFDAVRKAGTPGFGIDPRLNEIKAASGMNESIGSDGGFLVPPQLTTEVLRRVYESGAFASRVRRQGISSNSLKIPRVDETSRANGSRFGGVAAYWAGEAAAYTASSPKVGQMQLNLHKLTAACYVTEELLEDAVALSSFIPAAFQEEIAYKIDDAIMNGTGAGQPKGILNSDATVSVTKETGQAAATIMPENLIKMWSRCWAKSRTNAVWFINQDIEPSLHTMGMEFGLGGGQLVYMPAGGLSSSPYGTLYGRPVIPVEQCATLGTVGDIVLADLSQYLWVDKGGITASNSVHVRFLYDEMTYKFSYRADGQSLWASALTPANGSNTLSPFVTLATRS